MKKQKFKTKWPAGIEKREDGHTHTTLTHFLNGRRNQSKLKKRKRREEERQQLAPDEKRENNRAHLETEAQRKNIKIQKVKNNKKAKKEQKTGLQAQSSKLDQ